MRIKRKAPIQQRTAYAVLVDGETEAWYLQMLRRNEPSLGISIKPELPAKKTLKAQYEKVCDLAEEYDKVLWIIDLDTVRKETHEAAKGHQNAAQELITLRKRVEGNDKITVIINNPCLEFWFLLHFEYTAKEFAHCQSAENLLKRHIADYDKSKEFFTKQNHDMYLRLKPHLQAALQHSKRLPAFSPEEPHQSISEMHKLFEELKVMLETT